MDLSTDLLQQKEWVPGHARGLPGIRIISNRPRPFENLCTRSPYCLEPFLLVE